MELAISAAASNATLLPRELKIGGNAGFNGIPILVRVLERLVEPAHSNPEADSIPPVERYPAR
ncbi:hypothetical protein [Mesorhizobium sp. L-2-11]|uniref:hypothetical protein n=1 Tax=Mesorhizobium sp. L-2-11 TaxID=2744521 RepID=UPI001926EE9F|nr:hypothetical protein [Mesorhizobium sp. L-2-11]